MGYLQIMEVNLTVENLLSIMMSIVSESKYVRKICQVASVFGNVCGCTDEG